MVEGPGEESVRVSVCVGVASVGGGFDGWMGAGLWCVAWCVVGV